MQEPKTVCAFGFLCLHVNFMATFFHVTAFRLLQMIGKSIATQNTYSINRPEQDIYHLVVWNKLELYAYTLPVVPFSSEFLSSTSSKVAGERTVFSGSWAFWCTDLSCSRFRFYMCVPYSACNKQESWIFMGCFCILSAHPDDFISTQKKRQKWASWYSAKNAYVFRGKQSILGSTGECWRPAVVLWYAAFLFLEWFYWSKYLDLSRQKP